MTEQTQIEIDKIIQRASINHRDLVRRDLSQTIKIQTNHLILKLSEYFYNDGSSKELLCLYGTISCQYRGNRYNIPVEIWLQQDHPYTVPMAYVKPTSDMYVSPSSQDVQPDGLIIIPYLRTWRHPTSDLLNLLRTLSDTFSRTPPVYSAPNSSISNSNSNVNNSTTPYPINFSSMPTPMPMPTVLRQNYPDPNLSRTSYLNNNPSGSYPYASFSRSTEQTTMGTTGTIPETIYRDSLQSAVFDKIRDRLNEITQIGKAQIDSLKKTEQDLMNGENQIESFIENAQSQQIQIQNYLTNLQLKIDEISEAKEKMSLSSNQQKENFIRDDALIFPAPIYKQLFQCYAEEHAIQDLLFYLSDGLQRRSIHLEIYLKNVRELSRRQFVLRATMRKCRQIAGLTIKFVK